VRPDPADLLAGARAGRYALPAFNVNNMETVQGIVAAAEAAASPVMLQVSPGAIAYAGYEAIRDLAFAAADRSSVPVIVHLDHCRDPAVVRRALADGFPSVMFDGSPLAADENASLTRALVEEAHAAGAILEGELGAIGGSEDTTLEEARRSVATPSDVAAFVSATGVDILAPAMGTLHRMPDDSVELDLRLLASLAAAAARPLALHGGSGVARAQLPAAVASGIGKVNISSRVGRALADGILSELDDRSGPVDLRRYLGAGRAAVRGLGIEYMKLCGSAGRAASTAGTSGWTASIEEPE
jgi:fructose-bisphosphate aldolase, class II